MGVFDRFPGLTGGGAGAESPGDDDDSAVEPSGMLPSDFRDRAEAMTERSNVPTLDFTVASVEKVDELVAGPTRPVEDVVVLGCYVGEVLVRAYDATWVIEDGTWRVAVELEGDDTTVAVFEAARMSLESGPVFRAVLDHLEAEGATVVTTDPPMHRPLDEGDAAAIAAFHASDESAAASADDGGEETGPDGPLDDADGEDSAAVDDREDRECAEESPAETASAPEADDPDASGEGGVLEDIAAEADGPTVPSRSALADAARDFATAHAHHDLDFTPASLVRLDALIEREWAGQFTLGSLVEASPDPADGFEPLAGIGAYYGQVLVEHLDAEWVPTDDGEGAIEATGRGQAAEVVPVFDEVRSCLMGDSTFAYRFDALANRLGADVAARPTADVFEPDEGARASTTVIPAIIDRAESVATRWPEAELDFTPASLGRVDDRLAAEFATTDMSDVQLSDRTDPLALRAADRATGTGAYYAAVLVTHLDANWQIDETVQVIVEGLDGPETVDPAAVATAVVRGEDAFADHLGRLADRVGRARPSTD